MARMDVTTDWKPSALHSTNVRLRLSRSGGATSWRVIAPAAFARLRPPPRRMTPPERRDTARPAPRADRPWSVQSRRLREGEPGCLAADCGDEGCRRARAGEHGCVWRGLVPVFANAFRRARFHAVCVDGIDVGASGTERVDQRARPAGRGENEHPPSRPRVERCQGVPEGGCARSVRDDRPRRRSESRRARRAQPGGRRAKTVRP